jgi:peptide chain release factor subunit 1
LPVPPPDRELLRKLADWPTDGRPVTSLYLDVDGRRRPRRADLERQADTLLRRARAGAVRLDRDAHRSICRDAQRIRDFLGEDFDRKGTRGLAVFSCAGGGLWQEQPLSRPVRDRASVRPHPYLLPLEAMVERAETVCTALVDREKARILVSTLGQIEEASSILDEVPGRHDQGGWAQARHQRHIEDHVLRHLKRVAEALLRLHQRRGFHHLVLAGADEVLGELERELHDYVGRSVVDRTSLPMGASVTEVLGHTLEVEERLEREREEETVRRLIAGARGPNGRVVVGLDPTLECLHAARVETLVVAVDLAAEGARCPSCGYLAAEGVRCPMCGAATEPEPDLVEESVEAALRRGSRVETVPAEVQGADELKAVGGIGALLRF